ncbi:hypothetical protein K523DRAFT_398799 [Schizophyllum commune Tattone D]|nr:hypothetical protein K523DRAFT_398799 [Schizophyllum commune Tattone D]
MRTDLRARLRLLGALYLRTVWTNPLGSIIYRLCSLMNSTPLGSPPTHNIHHTALVSRLPWGIPASHTLRP